MSSAMGWATLRISSMPEVASMVRTLSNSLTRRSLTGWLTPSCARVSACAWSAARFTACPIVCANTATMIATPSTKPS